MKVSELYAGKYLTAADIGPTPYEGKIEGVDVERLQQRGAAAQNKLLLKIAGLPKLLVVNKTNATEIAAGAGDDVAGWVGVKLTLAVRDVEMAGKMVKGIRVVAVSKA